MTPEVVAQIEGYVRQAWSPEQIAGCLETTRGLRLSPQRIYQHIRADQTAGGRLYQQLRHSRKKRTKRYVKADARGQIKDRVSIDQRPTIVEEKSRIGDWEIDLVMGAKEQSALVSLVERRSRYTLLDKVASQQAGEVADKTVALLAPHKAHTQTITADNGKELPTIGPSARRWTRRSISPSLTMPGSAGSTKTPMASFASMYPKG